MAWTADDLDSIDLAIKSGELLVDFGDRKIRYRNFDELKEIRAFIQKQLDIEESASNASAFPLTLVRTQTCRGL